MKTYIAKLAMLAALAVPVGMASLAAAAHISWNTTGNYVVAMNYLGTDYSHDMMLTQNASGTISGSGGSPAGANVYTWVITSGTTTGNTIDLTANYTATGDAVTPQTVLHILGTIASNGSISGTWSDNYQGGARSGTWMTTTGTATPIATSSLAAEDFGVVNYDTGLGILKGYTAGFGLTNATFAGVQSVIMKLYAGVNLLQTNVSTALVGTNITDSQVSSPFDVSGNFNYGADGYWTNTRESQYGQSAAATKVVATVVLSDGTVLTAQNTSLTGDPTTIFATTTTPTTTPPTGTTTPSTKDQCKNGGWKTFSNPSFRSQGRCVSYVTRNNDRHNYHHHRRHTHN